MGLAKRHWEEVSARGFDVTGETAVCLKCIHDGTLREEAAKHLDEWSCSFCGAKADEESNDPIATPFEEFMYIVMRAINFLYMSVDDANLFWEEGEYVGGQVMDSTDVAYAVCDGDVTYEVLDAIADAMTLQLWTDSHISESPLDVALTSGWNAFCEKVKHHSRFVFLSTSEESSGHPDDFTTADLLARLERVIIENDLLLTLPAGQLYWRGRLVDDPSDIAKYRSVVALGAPPSVHASNNRMSPAGISLFYGSADEDTVVAEIGAHNARRYAVVGAFETTRELTLLNLANLPPLPSLYTESPPGQKYFERKFLRSFAADLGKPISLDGQEHIEYVPTRVITEYLRFIPDFDVHGILFRSSQNDGVNCVLFCGPEGCVDPDAPPRRPWQSEDDLYLRLKPESVKWVEIVATMRRQ